MTQIGNFSATEAGYSGHIQTISLDAIVTLIPAEPSESENAPDYRIILGDDEHGPEIGAGWKRSGEKAGAFVALQIDDPAFVQPLRANLFKDGDNSHVLVWNRPTKRDDKP
jgi:uncharacterized protein (DUF736 family)